MLGTVIGLIFVIIILGVAWWAFQRLIALVPLAEPFKTILDVLIVVLMVIVVIWILTVLLGMAGIHVPYFR